MHVSNWSDVRCLQLIDTVEGLESSYHANIDVRPLIDQHKATGDSSPLLTEVLPHPEDLFLT